MKGLFFYKLVSPYQEDVTRGCKLNICEVDSNFMTLKDASIESMEIDENNLLKLIPFGKDEKPIEVDLNKILNKVSIDNLVIEYDSKKGLIQFFNGEEVIYEVDKLLTKDNIHFDGNFLVTHDNTLIGNGTDINPLRISPVEETNSYRMVSRLIDSVNNNETLPTEPFVGERFLLYENANPFGYLYNFKAVQDIMNDITDTEWRVPTLEDWNNMLNVIDCLPNHGDNLFLCNQYFGEDAGHLLKSTNFWKTPTKTMKDGLKVSPNNLLGIDKYGMNILPCGKGTYNRGFYAFGEAAEFWTSNGEEATSDIFTKEFNYNESGVGQFAKNPNNYYALRLVKEYDGTNFSPITVINGVEYNTILMDMEDGQPLIWLAENIKTDDAKYNPLKVNIGDIELDAYYIVEWDGNRWLRKAINDGDKIFFELAPNGKQRQEYRLNEKVLEEVSISSIGISEDDNLLTLDEENKIKSELDVVKVNSLSYSLVGKERKPISDVNIDIPNTLNNVILISEATEADQELDSNVILGKAYLKFSFVEDITPIYIALSDLVSKAQYRAGNGINIGEDDTISIKLNADKSNFLELDENGLNLNKLDFNFIEE